MGALVKLVFLLSAGIAILIGYSIVKLNEVPEVPTLHARYWGPGESKEDDRSIKPFKINVQQNVIDDLKERLNSARPFQTPLENVQHHYGMNTKLLTEIVDYWKNKYDWKKREAYLNSLPQYTTEIQGLKIHFLHVKPKVSANIKVVPLLLIHGWPGSVFEFYEFIPILTTPQPNRDFVFEVIAPSLPGYGFSQGASKSGLDPAEMGLIFSNLMHRLGFKKYYLQGGDWGAVIVRNMASLFEEDILGVHSNMCFVKSNLAFIKRFLGSFYSDLIVNPLHKDRMYPLSKYIETFQTEFGYLHIQATKPDTVGVGLNDSPVGLAAYILEKFTTGTNFTFKDRLDGGLKEKFGFDKLLDNVMLYWVSNSITTSMRLYSEAFSKRFMSIKYDLLPINVPSACANFKNELFYTPESILKDVHRNFLQNTHYEYGGHFIAMEMPKILAKDLYEAVHAFRQFHVRNKSK